VGVKPRADGACRLGEAREVEEGRVSVFAFASQMKQVVDGGEDGETAMMVVVKRT
jgi:hypothetical protein